MESLENLFSLDWNAVPVVGLEGALLAMLIAFCIGHVVAWVYMWTHEGLSYSRMFAASLLAMPVIVALVMILMSGNIFIAFGLLAVFTVVRFRNVLKDTRDTTFVLWAIVEGMAAGTFRFGLGVLGALVIAGIFLYLRTTMFGGRHRYDVILTFQWKGSPTNGNGAAVAGVGHGGGDEEHGDGQGDARGQQSLQTVLRPIFRRHSLRAQLASQRSVDDGRVDLSYRLTMRDPSRARELVSELERLDEVERVALFRRDDESEA